MINFSKFTNVTNLHRLYCMCRNMASVMPTNIVIK